MCVCVRACVCVKVSEPLVIKVEPHVVIIAFYDVLYHVRAYTVTLSYRRYGRMELYFDQ